MPLTRPNDFPEAGGINPKDENHQVFDRKPPIKIYLKPLTQKVIEKNLWIETIAVIMTFSIGLAELFGRELSNGIYFAYGCILTVLVWRFINIENETHIKQTTVIEPKKPEEKITP